MTTVAQEDAVASRLRAAQDAVEAHGHDVLVVTTPTGMRYLSGFWTASYSRLMAVVVPAEGRCTIVVPSLEEDAARAAAGGDLDVAVWRDGDDPISTLAGCVAAAGTAVAVEQQTLPLARADALRAALPRVDLRYGSELLAGLRERKSPREVEAIRAAARILDAAVDRVFAEVAVGESEREISRRMAAAIEAEGCEELPLAPLALVGANSALPHGHSGDRRLEPGDILLIDALATHGGYVADICRCGVADEPTGEQRHLWHAVTEAHGAALAAVRPGVTCASVDRAAREVLEAYGLADRFIHRTGHGLGLEVHEQPFIDAGNGSVLESGMVFSVEPGVYLLGEGGFRLEDDVLVTDNGGESLTASNRELRVIAV